MATQKNALALVPECSFCGKNQHKVKRLIAGHGVFICDECIELCNSIIADEATPGSAPEGGKLPTPEEIVAKLDQYIIGQRVTKEKLAIAAYHHYRRMGHRSRRDDDVEVQKSNVLLIGPTGSGKTHTVETLARLLNVPYAKVDLTGITAAGWQGGDIADVLVALLHNSGGDLEKARFGVVMCDEVDKLTDNDAPGTSKGFGKLVQYSMLTLIEGTDVEVQVIDEQNPASKKKVILNTSNILFVFAGAFEGLEKTIDERTSTGSSIGFGANPRSASGPSKALFHDVQPEDLVKFGLDPQFVGRLPIMATLDDLSEAMLVAVLTEPKNSLFKQFAAKIKWDGAELSYDDDAILEIARKATIQKTGARGLRTICEKIFHATFLELPTRQKSGANIERVHLTARHVREGLPPDLIHGGQKLLKG